MPSFNVFGIKVDKTQTERVEVNKIMLEVQIDFLLNQKDVLKIVIIKKWL